MYIFSHIVFFPLIYKMLWFLTWGKKQGIHAKITSIHVCAQIGSKIPHMGQMQTHICTPPSIQGKLHLNFYSKPVFSLTSLPSPKVSLIHQTELNAYFSLFISVPQAFPPFVIIFKTNFTYKLYLFPCIYKAPCTWVITYT